MAETRHWQREFSHFAVWAGWMPREWLIGFRFSDDGIGVGPLYFGIGGYDRG